MIKVVCDYCGADIQSKKGKIMVIKYCRIESCTIPLQLSEKEEYTPNLHLCDECFSEVLEKLNLEEK